jgi:hypothetical protein
MLFHWEETQPEKRKFALSVGKNENTQTQKNIRF